MATALDPGSTGDDASRSTSATSSNARAADRAPTAWDLLLALAFVKLVVHAVSNGPLAWGYMTDELYFLDSSDHLQWGYVDHPPLSIAVLGLLRPLTGDAIFAIRILPALLGAATVVLSGLIARELGGRRTAQGLAALAALATPVVLVMSSYYSMNAFDESLWTLGAWLLLRIINGGAPWLWPTLGVVVGLGLLNKVSMLWFGAGIAMGLLLTPERRWLRTAWPWAGAGIAVVMFAPYVVWNARNGWPFLEFSRHATELKVGEVSLVGFAVQQLMALGYVCGPLWLAGLVFVFASDAMRRYRPLVWLFLTPAAILAASGGARPHYLAPAFPIAFACGAVLIERLAARRAWLPRAVSVALLLTLFVAAPIAIPLLPPAATVRYIDALGLRPPDERERGGALPMHLGLFFHAEAVLDPVARVFASLPPDEQARVEILTTSFGETGAINVLGRRRGLPRAIGRHNQYGLWGPGEATGDLMIVVHSDPADLGEWFESCERRAEIDCPYCMELMDAQAIYVCRHPRRPLRELWPAMRFYR
jgi:hypothetical protein